METDQSDTIQSPYIEVAEVEFELVDGLSELDSLESLIAVIANRFNLHLIKTVAHEFDPHGVTIVGIVGESHISVHTWPENNYGHIEIFSCRELPAAKEIKAKLTDYIENILKVQKRAR